MAKQHPQNPAKRPEKFAAGPQPKVSKFTDAMRHLPGAAKSGKNPSTPKFGTAARALPHGNSGSTPNKKAPGPNVASAVFQKQKAGGAGEGAKMSSVKNTHAKGNGVMHPGEEPLPRSHSSKDH